MKGIKHEGDSPVLASEMEGATGQGLQAAFRNQEEIPVNSQQGNKNFTITEKTEFGQQPKRPGSGFSFRAS